jgi:hypothetical protein
VDEFDHPFPQVQCVGFHAHKPIRLCANVNVKCYSTPLRVLRSRRSKMGGDFPEEFAH